MACLVARSWRGAARRAGRWRADCPVGAGACSAWAAPFHYGSLTGCPDWGRAVRFGPWPRSMVCAMSGSVPCVKRWQSRWMMMLAPRPLSTWTASWWLTCGTGLPTRPGQSRGSATRSPACGPRPRRCWRCAPLSAGKDRALVRHLLAHTAGLPDFGCPQAELKAVCDLEGKVIKACPQGVKGIATTARMIAQAEQEAAVLMQQQDPGVPASPGATANSLTNSKPSTRSCQSALALMSRTVSTACCARSNVGIAPPAGRTQSSSCQVGAARPVSERYPVG